LRAIYHECDLLIAEAVAEGVFDGLEPESLAGVLSAFTYEAKRASRTPHAGSSVSTKKRRTIHDRLGPQRRDTMDERIREITLLSIATHEVEDRYHVPHAREPDGRFATVIAAWARGAPLGTVLDLADVEVGLTSPGDFVRQAKQVGDLCEQLARLHERSDVADAAAAARDLVLRSVVVAGTGVHPITENWP
jgi:ATP-dependent RNA helicase HelY